MRRRITKVSDRAAWLEARSANLNASDIAALFHCSPYRTAYELWSQQTGRLGREDLDSAALRRGRIMEPAVAEALREAHPEWVIMPAREYHELPELRIGCTPDFYAWPSQDDYVAERGRFLIQAKAVIPDVFHEEWAGVPPAHYLVQVQVEMLVTGMDHAILAPIVLDGREFPVHEYSFPADRDFQSEVLRAAANFWGCVSMGVEPRLRHPDDGATLSRVYNRPTADDVLSLHGHGEFVGWCQRYVALGEAIKALEYEREALQSQVMAQLRNHAAAVAQDYSVKWTEVPETPVPGYVRKPYRRLSIKRKKGT